MNKLLKRYARAMWLPMTVLIVVIALFGTVAPHLAPEGKVVALAVVMASYGWAGWAEFRHMQRMDEMRRRIEMEAMVLGFIASLGSTLLLSFAVMLKLAAIPFELAPIVLVGCYLLAHLWARVRYRYWSL
ncbi:hypothetical protein [Frateuria sp. STR12]|uniref:hypothetical protein n=1 Tax=Frateuria hangzhouensis TaxID=2995589 RepID=UPI002260B5EB|nr:hypothetical protein [Frateuria sp. STR12]MCX7512614.1 hypothetical protein [Frateuria sp. STR12]